MPADARDLLTLAAISAAVMLVILLAEISGLRRAYPQYDDAFLASHQLSHWAGVLAPVCAVLAWRKCRRASTSLGAAGRIVLAVSLLAALSPMLAITFVLTAGSH